MARRYNDFLTLIGRQKKHKNCRFATPLREIYKLSDTSPISRITAILNLLTKDTQYAYKFKKSAIGIIYTLKKRIAERRINGLILLAPQKPAAE